MPEQHSARRAIPAYRGLAGTAMKLWRDPPLAEALDGILDSLRRDGDYMRRRAERQAEARQSWVEGLSFRPASIQQADRPPPSFGERVKESIDKVCELRNLHAEAALSEKTARFLCACSAARGNKLRLARMSYHTPDFSYELTHQVGAGAHS